MTIPVILSVFAGVCAVLICLAVCLLVLIGASKRGCPKCEAGVDTKPKSVGPSEGFNLALRAANLRQKQEVCDLQEHFRAKRYGPSLN